MGGAHHCSGPPVSEMTYTVSSGTLNPSIPYHTIPVFVLRKAKVTMVQSKLRNGVSFQSYTIFMKFWKMKITGFSTK